MSEAEWWATHADPSHLRQAASALRARAEELDRAFQRLADETDGARWEGQAARRFRAAVGDDRSATSHVRQMLESAADDLNRAAGRLEADLERVRADDRARAAREARERARQRELEAASS
jgi:WXG100 family type VII secretion target